jgi:GNAT superfamily N-acetyltransferase
VSPLFRAARAEDLPAIVALLAEDVLGAAREAPGPVLDPVYSGAFDAIAADPIQLLLVAEVAGEVAGTLQLSFIPGLARRGAWRGQVEAERVAARHRGAGLGEAMLGWAIATCRARGCALVQLTSDKARADAHRFYARLGFRATHEGYKLAL